MNSTTHPVEAEEVMAYLDGELAPQRAAAVAAHLEQCAECAALAADLRGVSMRAAEWQVEPAPGKFSHTIDHAVQTARSGKAAGRVPFTFAQLFVARRRWVWPAAAAAVAAVAILAVIVPQEARFDPEVLQQTKAKEALLVASPPPESTSAASDRGFDSGGGGAVTTRRLAETQRQGERLSRPLLGKAGPMLMRTASVTLETKQFDATRAAVERIVRTHGGHIGQLQTAAPANDARTLKATLRVPADQLDAALAEIKALGRVAHESQNSDEVTEQYTDLVARLANARSTEQRLVEILRTRTGKVEEVLEVEREIASVREEIERMEAQRKSLENRVALSTVQLELREEFEKKIGVAPPSAGTLLWNAMAEGLSGAMESLLALALFLLRAGPSLLLWGALLFLPARAVWRRMRAEVAAQ